MLLDVVLLVLVADIFLHCSRVKRLLKINMDSPLFTGMLRIRNGYHVVRASLATEVPVTSRPRWKVMCVCAWTMWETPDGLVSSWARVRHCAKASFLRSVPVQGGLSRVFETLLEMIFFFVVMSVIFFFEHTQCLIQRRSSTRFFTVRLSKQILLEMWVPIVVDVEQ